ncbi:hypothetical protein HK105_203335 [Polyrhizophydium stewartii]|uniref:Uncharacterized protein n=1 Tax=Polyrhizophydium stewartii TaxID=2732419 RepID=A0ABR4NCL4_9FUNG
MLAQTQKENLAAHRMRTPMAKAAGADHSAAGAGSGPVKTEKSNTATKPAPSGKKPLVVVAAPPEASAAGAGAARVRALREVTNKTPTSADRSAAKRDKAARPATGKSVRIAPADGKTAPGTGAGVARALHTPHAPLAIHANLQRTAAKVPSRLAAGFASAGASSGSDDDDDDLEEDTIEYMPPSTFGALYRFPDHLDVNIASFSGPPAFEHVRPQIRKKLELAGQLDLEPVRPPPPVRALSPIHHDLDIPPFEFDSNALII